MDFAQNGQFRNSRFTVILGKKLGIEGPRMVSEGVKSVKTVETHPDLSKHSLNGRQSGRNRLILTEMTEMNRE